MKTYKPGVVDNQSVQRELQSIAKAQQRADPHAELIYLHAEPAKLRAGMLVLADGTDWDPGSGVGLYRRSEDNTAWELIAGGESEEADLNLLALIATEQVRQLTKIALLLSAMSGITVEDDVMSLPTEQLRQLTKITLILSAVSGLDVDDIDSPIY